MELRERAYVRYREIGDGASAARMAIWLATQHAALYGNDAVADGWLARADRLIAELGPCVAKGWLLHRRSRRATTAAAAESLAGEALALALAHGDRELEVAALSQQGRARVAAGRPDEGFVCLDEAMAAATSGELQSPDTIATTCCDMIGVCERTMEIERASQWCQVTADYARRYTFKPLFAFCRVTYASLLISVGKWQEAEAELRSSLDAYRETMVQHVYHAAAKLAELRLLQGRDAEAEELLAEHTQNPHAVRAVAMLHLARGDAGSATRLLGKRLAGLEHDLLASAPLLGLLVEAELAAGEVERASAAAARLAAVAGIVGRSAFTAAAAYAAALVAEARGHATAVDDFERAAQSFSALGMPLWDARARLGIARCLAGENELAARGECRVATSILEELGARRDLDAGADLRARLGVGARLGPRASTTLTRREEEVLALLGLGLSNAKIGARLFISPKTVEHHVGHILDKLGLETRAAAAAYAVKAGAKKPATK
jgi:DNA-binding CsgD family transcriptional regulator